MRIVWLALIAAAALSAQTENRLQSPQVNPDRSVTLRFRDPNAKQVSVTGMGAKALPMQKSEEGLWTVTTTPLQPGYYPYAFDADGVKLRDPSNPVVIPNLMSGNSELHVPGPNPLPWELNDTPHGEIHHHFYHSKVVGDDRDFYVYTPPGYDPASRTTYPVLYLLHGFSDEANGWTAVGRANFILDNLIAEGKAKKMIVAMPLGYGLSIPAIFGPGGQIPFGGNPSHDRNLAGFRDALLTEVIPTVEKTYRAQTDRNSRAIAGLSMGGAESLFVGLNAIGKFGWIGAFSSGGLNEPFEHEFPQLDAKDASSLHLLWIACGTEDRLIEANRKLRDWLTSLHVTHTDIDTPGAHEWPVWRRNLAAFAPLLFEPASQTAAR